MKNPVKKIYEFHLKMDSEMKDNLKCLPLFKEAGNLSRLIVRILAMLCPAMEKKHLAGEQQMSAYQYINDDKAAKRQSVHVYLPDNLYRELKLMHHDLNFYSMAQLLRLFLRMFLDLVRLYGDKIEARLTRILQLWNTEREKRKYRWKPVRQLLHFIYQKPKISRFMTLYSNKFAPISIFRL